MIAETGIGRTTHRAIAARAGVPLGATTYYFPTLADLVTAALEQVADNTRAELERWRAAVGPLTSAAELPAVLSYLITAYLAGADGAQPLLDQELYLAAARDDRLRPLATTWLDGMRDLLTPLAGDAAHGLVAYLDGVMLQAVVTGTAPDADRVARDTGALLGTGTPRP